MNTILISIAAGSLLAALTAAQPHSQTRYTVIDLGALKGGTYSVAFGINSAGHVAGAAATSTQTDGFAATAVVWTKQQGIRNLVQGTPLLSTCPTCNSAAAAVDALGEVAVGSEIAALDPNNEDFGQWEGPFLPPTHRITRGFIWRNGVTTQLDNLPGGNNSNVFWMNSLGRVSGVAETDVRDETCNMVTPFQVRRFKGVVWGPNGQIERRLEPLQPDWVSYGFTINDYGQVVGASGPCATTGLPPPAISNTSSTHAVLWDRDGSVTDLVGLGGGRDIASSVNNRGEVLGGGVSPVDGAFHAWLWTRQNGVVDYGAFRGRDGTLYDVVVGCCHTINDRGEIVGFSIEPDNPYFTRALIWEGKEPKDLNSVVDPGQFVYLTGAFSINDSGEIVCQGVTNTGELHACVAVPNNSWKPGESGSVAALEPSSRVPLSDKTRELLRLRFGIRAR